MGEIAKKANSEDWDFQTAHFGKYLLLDRIADSVMSQVYLARLRISDGVNRILILKTLHSRVTHSENARKLFFREVETSMSLNHPNIVQVYDFGEIDGRPFIVMEWIHGRNLKTLSDTSCSRTGSPLSSSVAAWLVLEVAKALHYAHTFTDQVTGEPLHVVHRDLTPHNVMVSYDGVVKLIDFGIARMASRDGETVSDGFLGKARYLSPEQARGEKLDGRSDLFSLGSVFYELLTGRTLFDGDNDLLILDRVRNSEGRVQEALSQLGENVPAALLKILSGCLKQNRDERYASAHDLCRDLEEYVRHSPEACNEMVLARLMTTLFARQMSEDRRRLVDLTHFADAVGAAPPRSENGTGQTPAPGFVRMELVRSAPVEPQTNGSGFIRVDLEPPQGAPGLLRRATSWAILGVLSLGAFAWTWDHLPERWTRAVQAALTGSRELNDSQALVRVKLIPRSSRFTQLLLDGKPIPMTQDIRIFFDMPYRLTVLRDGFEPYSRKLLVPSNAEHVDERDVDIQLTPLRSGTLSIRTRPEAEAHLTNGQDHWVRKTPFSGLIVPPGDYQMRLVGPLNLPTKTVYFKVREGKETTIVETLPGAQD